MEEEEEDEDEDEERGFELNGEIRNEILFGEKYM
jgi:hypothetical protein